MQRFLVRNVGDGASCKGRSLGVRRRKKEEGRKARGKNGSDWNASVMVISPPTAVAWRIFFFSIAADFTRTNCVVVESPAIPASGAPSVPPRACLRQKFARQLLSLSRGR